MLPIAGWTEWAEFFCGHSKVAGECLRLIFFHGQRRALYIVIYKMFEVRNTSNLGLEKP